MLFFLKLENRRGVGGSVPNPSLASGGFAPFECCNKLDLNSVTIYIEHCWRSAEVLK